MRTKIFIVLMFLTIEGYGQSTLIFEQSRCINNIESSLELKERVIKKEVISDTLIVILGKREVCCATFQGSYIIAKDTLKLSYANIGDECFCPCFYELTFKISNMKTVPKNILFNKNKYPLTSQKFSKYKTRVDTLKNGNILHSKFEDEVLIYELENQDTVKIYRKYYNGRLKNEQIIRKNIRK